MAENRSDGGTRKQPTVSGNASTRLMPLVYDELRALARAYMRREGAHQSLPPTALVHEAYLRLADVDGIDWNGKTHFFAIAAREMRRVLVDQARARNAQKRGQGFTRVSLHENLAVEDSRTVDALALDEALTGLSERSERQCRIAEMRLFAGMTVGETAAALNVSERTVKQDWRLARAWLARELSGRAPAR